MRLSEPFATIFEKFDGRIVGTDDTKRLIVETIALLPDEIIDFVTKNCWFLSSMDDAWAFTFTGNDLKDQHLIFLSDDLLSQSIEQIAHTIIHEVGHVMLGHKNAILAHQSKDEVRKQEYEADDFARQYISNPNE